VLLKTDVADWVREAMKRAPLREAPLTHEVALETGNIHLPHRDPADRFLVATARVFGLTLVTADERLVGLKGLSVLGNR
jgi:PIN domain nuclease of toxin-antitoxin system